LLAILLDFGAQRSVCVAKGSAAMSTELIATISELSSHAQQLGVAGKPGSQDSGSEAGARTFRIEIALAIEVPTDGLDICLSGSIALRINL